MKSLSAAVGVALCASILPPDAPAEAAREKVLYAFCSQPFCADGGNPFAAVLLVKRELYVTASAGGPDNTSQGSVLAIDRKTGAADAVYNFANFGNLRNSEAALIHLGTKLYGTTAEGGSGFFGNGAGTVFALNPDKGTLAVLYSFCTKQDCADGAYPTASLVEMNGLLYGTTNVGGVDEFCDGPYTGCGTVFSLDPATGTEKVLHEFCQAQFCSDGGRPFAGLVAANGVLYGTTTEGGSPGGGTVFALDPNTGTESVVHSFAGGLIDGDTPIAGLLDANGLLYGTTEFGGGNASCGNGFGCGVVFSVDPATGTEVILHSFQKDGIDGQNPFGGLIDLDGKLYGTTLNGGAKDGGTVFSLDLTSGREKVLYNFCSQPSCVDGENPYSALTENAGKLYGTTGGGGVGNGVIFAIKP